MKDECRVERGSPFSNLDVSELPGRLQVVVWACPGLTWVWWSRRKSRSSVSRQPYSRATRRSLARLPGHLGPPESQQVLLRLEKEGSAPSQGVGEALAGAVEDCLIVALQGRLMVPLEETLLSWQGGA